MINAAGSRQQVFVETIFHTIYLCIVYDVQNWYGNERNQALLF